MADTATDPKTIPRAVFQKQAGGKKSNITALKVKITLLNESLIQPMKKVT